MAVFAHGELQMAILRHVTTAGRSATVDIGLALDVPTKNVSKAVSSLIARSYIKRVRIGIYEPTRLGAEALAAGRIITSGPIDKNRSILARPDTSGFRDRLWRSMRLRGVFTINDLVCDAVDTETDAITDTSRYIRILRSVGYVTLVKTRATGAKRYKRFQLMRNTGPRAPLHRSRLGCVHDFNTGEDLPCKPL